MSIILTPTKIWEDFKLHTSLKEQVVEEISFLDYKLKYLYFFGNEINQKIRVKIFGLYIEVNNSKGSILLSSDPKDGLRQDLALFFAKFGYNVLMVDLGGVNSNSKYYTIYPDELSYANYEFIKDSPLVVSTSAKETCWYEWTCVLRHGLTLLKQLNPTHKICGIGYKVGSNVLWQAVGVDTRFDAAVFLFAGFNLKQYINSENGIDKDSINSFYAGIDIQCYANKRSCPAFQFGTIDNPIFLSTEAHDAITRIKEWDHYYFTPTSKKYLDSNTIENIKLFLREYLCNEKVTIPLQPEIISNVDGDKIELNINVDDYKNVEFAKLYYSFNNGDHFYRSWVIKEIDLDSSGFCEMYILDIPNIKFDSFVEVKYKNGITLSSNFANEDVKIKHFHNGVLFSSNYYRTNFIHKSDEKDLISGIFAKNLSYDFSLGPNNILGELCNNSLLFYEISRLCKSLNSNSILKFDVYSKFKCEINIELRCSDGVKVNNIISLSGGEFWQNISFKFDDFVTFDNKKLDSYNEVVSITFTSSSTVILNNIVVLI